MVVAVCDADEGKVYDILLMLSCQDFRVERVASVGLLIAAAAGCATVGFTSVEGYAFC